MVEVFISKDVKEFLEEIPRPQKVLIERYLAKMTKKIPPLKKIPSSNLYVNHISKYVLIFSKTKDELYLMDIMGRDDFADEFRKSLFLF